MIWILLIIGIIGGVIYKLLCNNNYRSSCQIDTKKSMVRKYQCFIIKLLERPEVKFIKVTDNLIHFRIKRELTVIDIIMSNKFNEIEMECIEQNAMLGNYKKCTYSQNYSQQKLFAEIEKYIVEF